jgi:hypothetical protein
MLVVCSLFANGVDFAELGLGDLGDHAACRCVEISLVVGAST